MTERPRYPRVHVTRVVEEEGRQLREPVSSPICDFCGHDSPAWDYDCAEFIVSEDLASTGQWAACTPCSDMIEAGDWEGVLERCLAGARPYGLAERLEPQARAMHAGFREHRYGERTAWG